jgi:hypothetical protein
LKKQLQYGLSRIGVEYGVQTDLEYIIQSRQSQYKIDHKVTVPLNIIPIKMSNKESKGERINRTLGSFVRQGKVQILESCTDLIREMDMFTGKGNEDDNVVDAAAMLFPLVENFAFRPNVTIANIVKNSFYDIFGKKTKKTWRGEFNAHTA